MEVPVSIEEGLGVSSRRRIVFSGMSFAKQQNGKFEVWTEAVWLWMPQPMAAGCGLWRSAQKLNLKFNSHYQVGQQEVWFLTD